MKSGSSSVRRGCADSASCATSATSAVLTKQILQCINRSTTADANRTANKRALHSLLSATAEAGDLSHAVALRAGELFLQVAALAVHLHLPARVIRVASQQGAHRIYVAAAAVYVSMRRPAKRPQKCSFGQLNVSAIAAPQDWPVDASIAKGQHRMSALCGYTTHIQQAAGQR